MVFPLNEAGELDDRGYIENLQRNGLDVFAYKGISGTEAYLLIRCSVETLRQYAEAINFRMMLDPTVLKETANKGNQEAGIKPFDIADRPEATPYNPYEYIFCKYRQQVDEALYWRADPAAAHPFRSLIRLQLTALLIEAAPVGSEPLKIARYLRYGNIKGFFPLHRPEMIDVLAHNWLRGGVRPWKAPLFAVKEYLGEKIGKLVTERNSTDNVQPRTSCFPTLFVLRPPLIKIDSHFGLSWRVVHCTGIYFTFIGHYTKWLRIPAVIGFAVQVAAFCTRIYDPTFQDTFESSLYLPTFSFIVAMWAITMLEFWKRKEAHTSLRWGQFDFEMKENG